MKRQFLPAGAFLGFVAVILGAFGSHAFKKQLTPEMFDIYQTATQYLMIHALLLLMIGILATVYRHCSVALSGRLILMGTLLFSGSLYLYVFTANKTIAMITPIGGVMLLAGWLALIISTWNIVNNPTN